MADIEAETVSSFEVVTIVVGMEPVRLPRLRAYRVVKLQAPPSNTHNVYINDQYELAPGEQVELALDWTDKLVAVAADDDQRLTILVA